MGERYAVVFQMDVRGATGALEIAPDHLLLHGQSGGDTLDLKISYSDLTEIRVGRAPDERLNGYPTLVLQHRSLPAIRVAPLGMALLPEITSLLSSLCQPADGDVLCVLVPLKPDCFAHARKLLDQGPPLDPASLGLSSHEVYLREGEAIFVFRGSNVRAQIGKAIRNPAVWRAGLAWQRCFAAPPRIVEPAEVWLEPEPAYRWTQPNGRTGQ